MQLRAQPVARGILWLVLLGLAFPSAARAQAGSPAPEWLSPLAGIGSPAEDRARLRQLLGREDTEGFLVRSPSSRTPGLAAEGDGVRWWIVPPEVDAVWNGQIPFSLNDGALWAGRGANLQATAGAAVAAGPVTLVLAPQLTYSENRAFQTLPSVGDDRSAFASPWYAGAYSADLPLRFGDRPLLRLHPGQSSLSVRADPVVAGVSTENQWWGPGIRNAIVLSDQAEGFPHLFVRTAAPVRTRFGSLEGKWIAGGLTESLFFDTLSANDVRSLSGFAATFRPAAQPDLTVGLSRVVYGAVEGAGGVPGRALDAFLWWGEPSWTPPDSAAPDSAAYVPAEPGASGREQVLSLFGRWVFPREGLEVYAEWARLDLPSSPVDLLNQPNHTQGYTLGLQWARPVREEGVLRFQSELTYLEESATFNNRPTPVYYVSRSVRQGYTQRGQGIGAAVGPGGSGQWIAGDYLAPGWSLGAFGGRIRWNNDVYYLEPGRAYIAHDVSVFGGLRGGGRVWSVYASAELSAERRYNYLFQNPETEPYGDRAIDLWNQTLRITLTPYRPR